MLRAAEAVTSWPRAELTATAREADEESDLDMSVRPLRLLILLAVPVT